MGRANLTVITGNEATNRTDNQQVSDGSQDNVTKLPVEQDSVAESPAENQPALDGSEDASTKPPSDPPMLRQSQLNKMRRVLSQRGPNS